jgi:hypothetical protein
MKCVFLPLVFFCAAASAAEPEVSFNRDIRPILADICLNCHGPDAKSRKADLRLDSREGATLAHEGIRAIVPGSPAESDAIARIFSDDKDEVMPPPKYPRQLNPREKELLKRWVAQGANYEPHWAYLAPHKAALPSFPDAAHLENPIDRFVQARLVAEKLAPSPEAAKGALLRRVTLDLTGTPPSPGELEDFENDARPDAYESRVDLLLASPRFGERMALDWLDAARYADTNGFQGDALRMQWPWRDWVVRAFNANMPFDRFTIEQLAGDLLPEPTQDQLIATGFNRNHMLNAEGGTVPEENRTKNVFDRVETTSTVWLGLTLQCAQCHDHKFDPLKQRDYYAMFAMFNQLSEPGGVDKRFGRKSYSDEYDKLYSVESPFISVGTPEQMEQLATATAARKQADDALYARAGEYRPEFERWVLEMRADPELLEKRVTEDGLRRNVNNLPLENLRDGRTRQLLNLFLRAEPRWAALPEEYSAALDRENDVQYGIPLVMVMRDDKARETHLLDRGNYETPKEKVEPNVPAALPPLPAGVKPDRLALARWLVAPENPLTARVTVNRFWQQFFGRGIVKTPGDFGVQSPLPSHPELLDWLAVDFRENGWDVKRLVRLIVTSLTYRQSAASTPELNARDPDNTLLARGPRFRLDSRVLRDQALALSGLLVEKSGGPAVMPYQPAGVWEEMSFGKNRYFQAHGEDLHRRSLYTFWRRSVAPTGFFDVPARQVCAVKPLRTNTPLQALTTLNDTTYVEAARVWAEHLATLPDDAARLRTVFKAATARELQPNEQSALQHTLDQARAHFSTRAAEATKLIGVGEAAHAGVLPPAEHAAWTTLCLLVLNLDETLTK